MKSCSSWRSDLASSIFCWQNTTVRRGRRDGPLHRLTAHWLESSHVTQSWPLIGWPACREGWESYYCKLQLEKRKWYRVDNCTGPNLQINFTVGTKYFQRANLICFWSHDTFYWLPVTSYCRQRDFSNGWTHYFHTFKLHTAKKEKKRMLALASNNNLLWVCFVLLSPTNIIMIKVVLFPKSRCL